MKPELLASGLLLAGLVLIAAGAFGFGWRIGSIVTGCALLAALKILVRTTRP